MTKARILADFISDGSSLADGTISVAEVSGAAPLASPTFTGTASGTFSGPLTGAVTGNVTGAVTGNVTGNLTGAVTGNVTGNLTGDVLGDLDLTAISATIADTAVDIFVYDTSKDSDGGAWRKRTQGTSWYNETLGTGTRGSRKEFPAVAVIVAESNQVTIYDGDDPSLPMWMVFNTTGSNMIRNAAVNSISSINGILCVGANQVQSIVTLNLINFAKDVSIESCASGGFKYAGSIEQRNDGLDTFSSTLIGAIVNNNVNDVAMTVLPNAPIDAATGLPVPTIAVATNGGVSVIKDDGTVVDLTNSGYESNFVNFQDEQIVLNLYQTSSNNNWWAISYHDIPSSDITGLSSTTRFNGSTDEFPSILGPLTLNPSAISKDSLGNSSGLTNIYRYLPDYDKSMVAYTTSDYATGWMNGDIKLATLSDTDDTDVTGTELVTNTTDRDFSGALVNWAGTISPVGGVGVLSDGTTVNATLTVSGLTVGQRYVISFDIPSITTGTPRMYIAGADTSGINYSTGSNSRSFTPSSTSITVVFYVNGAVSGNYQLDNISVRLAEEDRSVNANGLQVFGTVTKNPVATGADLVAYSGFSASNYLEQPYNADLQFGTGDFCFSYWIKFSSIAGENIYSTVGTGTSSGTEGVAANTAGSGTFGFAVYTNGIQSSGRTNCGFTYTPPTNTWICVQNVRRSGVLELWINGELDTSVANTADINATDSFTRLGGHSSGSVGGSTSLSLFRASATAPSAEQIAKIYNDEKVLFQENAQATLYGSSDAVTALAYDDTTELLHVGTSQGRSVFQGLRRVDNTTSAVGAAISASNGLVAED
jgi:trimeric autotransporter adhesin